MSDIAKKSNWKTKPIPQNLRCLQINIGFSDDEFKDLQKGIIPNQMEHKWFIYFENNNLYCYRSWTGYCIYIGKFKQINNKWFLHEIIINNDKQQYTCHSDYYEVKLFLNLIYEIPYWNSTDNKELMTFSSSLIAMEHYYCQGYESLQDELTWHYKRILGNDKLKLDGNEITKAIILRLKTYYESHDKVVDFLNKKSVTPASDFFVETVLFYLKLILEHNKSKLIAQSEVRITAKNSYIKPDISIWKGNKVVAIIECKTNLGFRRKKWENDFKSRIKILKDTLYKETVSRKVKAFLLVLSSKNWSGFDKYDKRVGKQYFALSKLSLRKIKKEPLDNVVENKIEDLFSQILNL